MGVSRKFAIDNGEAMANFLQQVKLQLQPPVPPTEAETASSSSSGNHGNNGNAVGDSQTSEDASNTIVEGVVTVEEVASSSQCVGLPSSSSSSSSSARCKRRATEKCIHNLCFQCCYDHRKHALVLCQEVGSAADVATQTAAAAICPPHYMKIVKRDREDKYIEDGLLGVKKMRPLPNLTEERFSHPFQTVVIWSTKDFVANKRWSEDTFTALLRQERQRKLSAKRQRN